MPTFCRHNRFVERCPICSKALPGNAAASPSTGRPARAKTPAHSQADGARSRSSTGVHAGRAVRVHREGRAADDGYRCELVPGLRASADALRLVEEIAFSCGRLLALAAQPPALYGEARSLAATDLEHATWMCFLIAYLCPTEAEDPFAGIRLALAAPAGELPELGAVTLGPRTSHDPARGGETLIAYRQWVARAGAHTGADGEAERSQAHAFAGDPAWSAGRRFERLFERLALPGFTRAARYELLVLLGRLGLYELLPDSLHLAGGRGASGPSAIGEEATMLAAKRVFGIGDPLLLERRARALAQNASVPIEALDLALANWAAPQPARLGFPRETSDADAFERVGAALEL
jgi:hypothetical protein